MTPAAARRQRLYRPRCRHGVALLTIPVDPHRLAEALIDCGRLSPAEALCKGDMQRAIGELLCDWAAEVEARCRD